MTRDELINALDSPTIAALAKVFGLPGAFTGRSYSEQVAEILEPRLCNASAQTEQVPLGYIVRNKVTGKIASQHVVERRPDAEEWARTFRDDWELQPIYLSAGAYTITEGSR